jgi:uncharacterized protein YjbJ (UPF0337 family)
MNKDRVKGTIDEAVGKAKRKLGSLTSNRRLQAEGMVQQAKGVLENAWGEARDGERHAEAETERRREEHGGAKEKSDPGKQ